MPAALEYGAIFYPQTNRDPDRLKRAHSLGAVEIPYDSQLAQTTKPLFPGHDQPRTYCLGSKDKVVWDDSEPDAMSRQVELAKDAGLTFFIFDTYQGLSQEQPHRELYEPIETFQRLDQKFGFASLAILGRPRVLMPLKLQKNSDEPGRYYEINTQTAQNIIDIHAENYWKDPRYLQITGRPYMAVMFPMGVHKQLTEQPQLAADFIAQMREHAYTKYRVNPYIAGVLVGNQSRQTSQKYLVAAGVDALTGYALLPNFGDDQPFIQDYQQLIDERIRDWDEIRRASPVVPFSPPAVVGWDATARGSRIASNDYIRGEIKDKKLYPFHPIVYGGTPELFGEMVRRSCKFIQEHSPEGEQVSVVCAMNEMGEGACMLPRVIDGEVDTSYLKAYQTAIRSYKDGGSITPVKNKSLLEVIPDSIREEKRFRLLPNSIETVQRALQNLNFEPTLNSPVATYYLIFRASDGSCICLPNIRLRSYKRDLSLTEPMRLEVKSPGNIRDGKHTTTQTLWEFLSHRTLQEHFPYLNELLGGMQETFLLQTYSNRTHYKTVGQNEEYPRLTIDQDLKYRLYSQGLEVIAENNPFISKIEIKTKPGQRSMQEQLERYLLQAGALPENASDSYLGYVVNFIASSLAAPRATVLSADITGKNVETRTIDTARAAEQKKIPELTREFPNQEVQLKFELPDGLSISDWLNKFNLDLRRGDIGPLTILPDWDVGEDFSLTDQRFLNHMYGVRTPGGMKEALTVVEAELTDILNNPDNYRDIYKTGVLEKILTESGFKDYPSASIAEIIRFMIDRHIPLYVYKEKHAQKFIPAEEKGYALYISDEERYMFAGNEQLETVLNQVSEKLGQELEYVGTYRRIKKKLRFTNTNSGRDYTVGADSCEKTDRNGDQPQGRIMQIEIELKNRRGMHQVNPQTQADAVSELLDIGGLCKSRYNLESEARKKFTWLSASNS